MKIDSHHHVATSLIVECHSFMNKIRLHSKASANWCLLSFTIIIYKYYALAAQT